MTAAKAAALVTLIMLGIGVRFGAGYLVGKAMAPDEESEQKFAWGGALASVFFGTLGLGVEGIVALNARKD
jgi:Na+-driven multidrug efflux pump